MTGKKVYDELWESKLSDAQWLSRDGEGRVQYAVDLLQAMDFSGAGRIFDVGCGRGTVGIRLGRTKGLWGLDISLPAVREAARVYDGAVVGDASTGCLPFRESTFDVCLMLDVVEHLPDPRVAIREVFRVLRPNGVLLTCTPNILNWRQVWKLVSSRRFPKTSGDPEPYDGGHLHFFTYADLAGLLRGAGFDDVSPVGPLRSRALYEFREPMVWLLARRKGDK